MLCYDPTTSDKGSHAYPYRYQVWAYDLNDFAAVKAGTKQPWEVVPYGVWPLSLPDARSARSRLGGVGLRCAAAAALRRATAAPIRTAMPIDPSSMPSTWTRRHARRASGREHGQLRDHDEQIRPRRRRRTPPSPSPLNRPVASRLTNTSG